MTLLIACLVIAGCKLHWCWYIFATALWIVRQVIVTIGMTIKES